MRLYPLNISSRFVISLGVLVGYLIGWLIGSAVGRMTLELRGNSKGFEYLKTHLAPQTPEVLLRLPPEVGKKIFVRIKIQLASLILQPFRGYPWAAL